MGDLCIRSHSPCTEINKQKHGLQKLLQNATNNQQADENTSENSNS